MHPLITAESQNLPFPQHCESNKITDLGGGHCVSPAGLWVRVRNENLISYFSTKTYVVGTQKNRLNVKIDG